MKRVAIVSYLPTHFVELRRVALALRNEQSSRNLEPLVCFARAYPGCQQNIAFCEQNGIAWRWTMLDGSAPPALPLAPASPATNARGILWNLPAVARIPLRLALSHRRARRQAAQYRNAAERLLRETSAAVVVIAEDNLDYGTPWLVKAAHEAGAKVVVVPFTIANELEFAEAFFDDEMRRVNASNRWFARRHPQWAFEHRGRTLLRSQLPVAMLAESAGIAPPKPWILNSGASDAIATESEAMQAHYLRCGIPATQLVVTGSLSDDALFSRLSTAAAGRAELLAALGLPEKKRLVVTGLSPDQVKDRPRDSLEFASYEELARSWIGALTAMPDTNVVVSLHPSTAPETVAFIEDLGARIARGRDIATLIPLADLYVAGASATIRLAIACGKPVVNFDAYRFRYSDYTGIPGITTVETLAELRAVVLRMAQDAPFFESLAKSIQEIRREIGRLQADYDAMWALTKRNVSQAQRTGMVGPGGSVFKLFLADVQKRSSALAYKLLGRMTMAYNDLGEMTEIDFVGDRVYTLTLSIAAGTSQIQRNIIGERVLGLPKER